MPFKCTENFIYLTIKQLVYLFLYSVKPCKFATIKLTIHFNRMKTLKHVTLAIFLMVTVTLQINAQNQRKQGVRQNGNPIQALKQKLNLSDEQTEKIKNIMAEQRKAVRDFTQSNPNATKQEKTDAMKAQLQKTDAQILAVLNPEQQAIYNKEKNEKKAELKERHQQRRRNRAQ